MPTLATHKPKIFVLDTNILLQYPDAIYGFADNEVVVCGTVLQELDSKKEAAGDLRYNAREAINAINSLQGRGDVREGILLDNGGIFSVEIDGVSAKYLPMGYDIARPDNRIISVCLYLKSNNPDRMVILVSNDISLRINANACGVLAQEYRNSIIIDSGYKGYIDIDIDQSFINDVYKYKRIPFREEDFEPPLLENEFVTLHCGRQSALTVYRMGNLELINRQKLFGWVEPMNALQTYAMWALKQPSDILPLVILVGPAGCAKTFLSLAAGLDSTYTTQRRYEAEYDRVLLSRPIANSFDDIGFLPGGPEEKLRYLYDNFYDNIKTLLKGNKGDEEDPMQVQQHMDDLLESGVISVLALNFIRGRSLIKNYTICDEAQNATSGCIRDVVTRAGFGSKIVLAGDPTQIDVPYLSSRSNGLVYAAEHMKGDPTTALIVFDKTHSVRSPLALAALNNMKR